MQALHTAQDDIEEMFERIDENGDRRISFDEFASVMLELDHARSACELRVNFNKIDTNHDGWLSFDEFSAWCS